MNIDFSFYNWEVIRTFIIKGFYFSVLLTVVATAGGVLFGTLLAMMRLSGRKLLQAPATFYVNGMRSIPLVMVILWFFLLVPGSFYAAIPWHLGDNYRSEILGMVQDLRGVRGGLLQRDHARRHPVHSAWPGVSPGQALGHDLQPEHEADHPAAAQPRVLAKQAWVRRQQALHGGTGLTERPT